MNPMTSLSEVAPAPVVSVVIPSYNRKESVLTLLADLERQEGVPFEVIVVDDASPDGSADAIAAAYPRITLLRNETNGGPCVARNRGIRAARSEIIVGLDSDVTVPDATLLARVVSTFAKLPEQVAVLAFRLLQPDGISEDKARWWHPVPIEKFANQTFETSYFSGTGYALRRPAALAAGLFPEILYMHYEEVELAWRILDAGRVIRYSPILIILHHANPTSRRSEISLYYKPRNQLVLALTSLPMLSALKYGLPRLAYQFLKAITGRHVTHYLRALRDAVRLENDPRRTRGPLKRATIRRINRLRRIPIVY